MASNRQVKTPGAAPESTVDETKSNDEVKTTEQQPADTTPNETQTQSGDTGSDAESTVDHAALIEELRQQLAASEANNQALKGQLRREATKPSDAAIAPIETVQAGTPYLSPKGWTRG
jgi:hypothetical protein